MPPLESLVRDAVSAVSPGGSLPAAVLTADESEVQRIMQICNACRYCEGFCAVFPAMTHRLEFAKNDVNFLANLCHNCGACLHSCQYAPPHEFAVNVPRAMARVRRQTYAEYAWPAALGALYRRNGLVLALATAIGLAFFLVLALALRGTLSGAGLNAGFYAVFTHNTMAVMFGVVFLFAIVALGMSVTRFWRDQAPGPSSAGAVMEATRDTLRLKYLDGGHGEGCTESDDAYTLSRRRFHHITFYGFLSCFAATCVGTVYHYLFHWEAPYAYWSLPVFLGTVGGIGLLVGPAGLLWLNVRRYPLHGDPDQKPMDRGFIALLMLVSATGLLLLGLRDTAAMAVLVAIHLGAVMAFFATMPYGKFAHGIYRCAALLKWAVEKRHPPRPGVDTD
jgi:citrate/tricarballylate utilization protein